MTIEETLDAIFQANIDPELQDAIYNHLTDYQELKKETEEKSILEMAYDIHMKIMSKNQWCYGDNECGYCDVREMCQAASKLRDEIFKHDSKEAK